MKLRLGPAPDGRRRLPHETGMDSGNKINARKIFGVGPALALAGLGAAALVAGCDYFLGARACLPEKALFYSRAAGMILAAAGMLLWADSVRLVLKGSRENRLITTGAFKLTRNPMYAAIMLFIIPGGALILNNLLFILASAPMLIVFKLLIGREERRLREQYGSAYEEYAGRVSRLIPGGKRCKSIIQQ